jgi:hypothetical protein
MPPELTKQVKRHPIFHALVTSSTEITYNNPDLILHRGLFDEVAIVRSSQNSQFPDYPSFGIEHIHELAIRQLDLRSGTTRHHWALKIQAVCPSSI